MSGNDTIFLPVSLNISDKKILIIGGGKTGFHKATILSRFTNKASIVSPTFHEGFGDLPFVCIAKEYERSDLDGVFLVYICTENSELNQQIKNDAVQLGILASVCDNPMLCDFISPAVFKENNVTIAVSSNAQNVHQSINIRNRIEELVENGTIQIS
jgi:siroheme synthase-like protein